MNAFQKYLLCSTQSCINLYELAAINPHMSLDARYSLIKRAIQQGMISRLKRGVYLINKPYRRKEVDLFEIAQLLYSPSYISVESALSYHGWIPEAVYTTTSVCSKRKVDFNTPIGFFSFEPITYHPLCLGVERKQTQDSVFLMATPEKALIDYCYTHKKQWPSVEHICGDLRIEKEDLATVRKPLLRELLACNPPRIVKALIHLLLGIHQDELSNY